MVFSWLKQFLFKKELDELNALKYFKWDYMQRIAQHKDDVTLKNRLNNKYPKTDIYYAGRQFPGTINNISLDLRNFFQPNDSHVKIIARIIHDGSSHDIIAINCLAWIIKNIKYVSDIKKTKTRRDFWQFPFETLHCRTGDCEDGAILLANLMIAKGIPYWKIRLSAGWVNYQNKKVGHAYLNYYCEDLDKWVILDWCYYPNALEVADRKDYQDEENYKDVWFSWNRKYCYTKGLNKEAGKVLKKK